MSSEKTTIGDKKVISFQEIVKDKGITDQNFSQGFYHWVMFILTLYTRVRESLKMDFESFVILQVVVSHSVYEANKSGGKTFSELEDQMSKITQKKSNRNSKLTFASIAEVLQLPRETVRRKVLALTKRNYLAFNNTNGIKLGSEYKTIYKNFVTQTTLDLSSVIRKWKSSGALETLIELGDK